jgi:hypothetical protein
MPRPVSELDAATEPERFMPDRRDRVAVVRMHGVEPSFPLPFAFGLAREVHPEVRFLDLAGGGCAPFADGDRRERPIALLPGRQLELRLADFGDVEQSAGRPARLAGGIVEDLALVGHPAHRAVAPDDAEVVVDRAALDHEGAAGGLVGGPVLRMHLADEKVVGRRHRSGLDTEETIDSLRPRDCAGCEIPLPTSHLWKFWAVTFFGVGVCRLRVRRVGRLA